MKQPRDNIFYIKNNNIVEVDEKLVQRNIPWLLNNYEDDVWKLKLIFILMIIQDIQSIGTSLILMNTLGFLIDGIIEKCCEGISLLDNECTYQ